MSGTVDMQAGWDAAVAACLNGHEHCSYGGMTPGGGYWLADGDCRLDHHDTCAWCQESPTTGFAGWAADGWSVYGVPACEGHAAAWAAEHPEWARPGETANGADPLSFDALVADFVAAKAARLAAMPEELRRAWEAADQAVENMLLWGNPEGPGFDGFDGLGELFGVQVYRVSRSAFSSEYRRRRRARVKRRRR